MSDETPETPPREAEEAGVHPELAVSEDDTDKSEEAHAPDAEAPAAMVPAAESALAPAAPAAPEPVGVGYRVELPAFEGPLDLLLHLIEEHELDIFDIPIAFIAAKFVEYITLLEELNIDVASEYLVMAATLAHIKSKQLLPVVPTDQEDEQEPELDPRAELVRRLLEYQKYKHVAEQLAGAPVLGRDVFLRGVSAPEAEGPAQLTGLSLFKLLDAFQLVLARVKATVDHTIDLERFSITDRINQLSEILARGGRMAFVDLFDGQDTRADLIITFLALLEMTRLRLTRLFQDGPLAPIEVELAVSPDELGAAYSDDDLGMESSDDDPGAESPDERGAESIDETPAGDADRNE